MRNVECVADPAAETDLRAQRELLESLVAVARATSGRSDLTETLKATLDIAARLTGAEGGSLCLLDKTGRMTSGIFVHGGVSSVREDDLADVLERGLAGWVTRHRQPVLVTDTHADPRWVHLLDQGQVLRSIVSVPLVHGDRILGVLGVDHSEPGHFQPEHLELLVAAGEQIGLALRAAQVLESRTRAAERQAMLYRLLHTLTRQHTAEGVMQSAMATLSGHTRWQQVRVIGPEGGPDAGDVTFALRHDGTLFGWLLFRASDVLSADETALAESVADAIALALSNARLHDSVSAERAQLAAVLESSRDGMLMVGLDRRVLLLNGRAANLLGVDVGVDAYVGEAFDHLLHAIQDHAPEVASALGERLGASPHVEPPHQGTCSAPPRRLRWLDGPVMLGERCVGRLVVLRDVTVEHAAERLREDLTGTLVHDLKSPLNAVSIALDQLRLDAPTDSDSARVIHIAERSLQRVVVLVDAILEIGRLEDARVPLSLAPIDVAEVAREVLALAQPMAAGQGTSLELRAAEELPVVTADRQLVSRVMQNLVGNAVKYGGSGGVVEVHVCVAAADGVLRVSIVDHGPGLPPYVRKRLFQKFVRGVHASPGTGLGLAFCRLAVEAHGGTLALDQATTRGTTMHFTLPLARER